MESESFKWQEEKHEALGKGNDCDSRGREREKEWKSDPLHTKEIRKRSQGAPIFSVLPFSLESLSSSSTASPQV